MLNWRRIPGKYLGMVFLTILGLAVLASSWATTRSNQVVGELLVAANIRYRPVAARLSTLPQYAPYQPQLPVPLSKQLPKAQRIKFNQLMASLLSNSANSPEKALSLATIYLVESKLTEAIESLELALSQSPQDAALLNDLAVAYLQRAQQENKPFFFIKALSKIDLAITNNSQLTIAYFNRALILESLYLLPAAQTAWQQYLARETVTAWQQEAITHQEQLATALAATDLKAQQVKLATAGARGDIPAITKLVIENPQVARAYTLEYLLANWANNVEQNIDKDFSDKKTLEDSQAAANLHFARQIGQLLAVQQGDKLLLDAVSNIEQAYQTDVPRLAQLAQAYRAYAQGDKLWTQDDSNRAEVFVQQAITLFQAANDPAGTVITTLLQAKIWISRYEYRLATAALEQIQIVARERSYLNALGRAYWISGNIYSWRYEIDQALVAKEAALNYLKITGDAEGVAMAHFLLADTLTQLGKFDEIWEHQYQALQWLSRIGQTRFRLNILLGIADGFRRSGELRAALYFQNALLGAAQEMNNTVTISYGFLQRSFIYQQLNQREAAQTDLNIARQYLQKIPPGPFYERVLRHLRIAEGDYLLATNPAQAITIFSDLISLFANAEDRQSITHLYLSRARAYLMVNDELRAEADLNASIQEWERQRQNISNERQRISFFEETLATYEKMLDLLVTRRHKPDAAFYYAEASRGRVLLDLLVGGGYPAKLEQSPYLMIEGVARPFGITSVQQRLPSQTALIEYAWLSDKLLIWVIKPQSTHFAVSPLAPNQLENLVQNFNQAIKEATVPLDLMPAGGPLYQVLLQPVADHLRDVTTLAIVPDKELHQIPFAALLNPQNKRFLIEDFIVETTPSATIFLHCLERDAQLSPLIASKVSTRVKNNSLKNNQDMRGSLLNNSQPLLIGNPAFDRQLFPKIAAYLPAAETEVTEIAALYPQHQLLIGEQATKKRFFAALENSNILHFAGHGIIDPDFPLNSKLLLTPMVSAKIDNPLNMGSKDNGVLYAYELYNQRFAHTKLAILSACRTAKGVYISGEGVTNLARPLLAAGVPAVVASLENVNDETTAQFFVRFHHQLITNGDPATALRQTQLAAMQSEDKQLHAPSKWAMFIMIGGVNIRGLNTEIKR